MTDDIKKITLLRMASKKNIGDQPVVLSTPPPPVRTDSDPVVTSVAKVPLNFDFGELVEKYDPGDADMAKFGDDSMPWKQEEEEEEKEDKPLTEAELANIIKQSFQSVEGETAAVNDNDPPVTNVTHDLFGTKRRCMRGTRCAACTQDKMLLVDLVVGDSFDAAAADKMQGAMAWLSSWANSDLNSPKPFQFQRPYQRLSKAKPSTEDSFGFFVVQQGDRQAVLSGDLKRILPQWQHGHSIVSIKPNSASNNDRALQKRFLQNFLFMYYQRPKKEIKSESKPAVVTTTTTAVPLGERQFQTLAVGVWGGSTDEKQLERSLKIATLREPYQLKILHFAQASEATSAAKVHHHLVFDKTVSAVVSTARKTIVPADQDLTKWMGQVVQDLDVTFRALTASKFVVSIRTSAEEAKPLVAELEANLRPLFASSASRNWVLQNESGATLPGFTLTVQVVKQLPDELSNNTLYVLLLPKDTPFTPTTIESDWVVRFPLDDSSNNNNREIAALIRVKIQTILDVRNQTRILALPS